MAVKYEVSVTAIGKLARKFLETNSSIILLDEGAHPNLAEMVIEHTSGDLKSDITVGDTLTLGKQKYNASVRTRMTRSATAGTARCSLTQRALCQGRSNWRVVPYLRSQWD